MPFHLSQGNRSTGWCFRSGGPSARTVGADLCVCPDPIARPPESERCPRKLLHSSSSGLVSGRVPQIANAAKARIQKGLFGVQATGGANFWIPGGAGTMGQAGQNIPSALRWYFSELLLNAGVSGAIITALFCSPGQCPENILGRSGGMVDAPVSKTGGSNPVSVRVRPSAPLLCYTEPDRIRLKIERPRFVRLFRLFLLPLPSSNSRLVQSVTRPGPLTLAPSENHGFSYPHPKGGRRVWGLLASSALATCSTFNSSK